MAQSTGIAYDAKTVANTGAVAMTDLSIAAKLVPYKPKHKVRFVTAAALFDGHDASINIMRRILQSTGSEVIHLGHNRSVGRSSMPPAGRRAGHRDHVLPGRSRRVLQVHDRPAAQNGGENIKVFGGGGGVIVPAEIKELHDYGVTRIYSVEDGAVLGLQGMINDLVERCDQDFGGRAQGRRHHHRRAQVGDRRAAGPQSSPASKTVAMATKSKQA
jgi:methylmalonyl-CoA mutase